MQFELTNRGLVFAKHYPVLNRCQADIAFPEKKLAVFCDGDYWHNRPDVRSRDVLHDMILKANKWHILRLWEHENQYKSGLLCGPCCGGAQSNRPVDSYTREESRD